MPYTYKFANQDINKFSLLLWKDVYPNEYTDDWEKFSETSLPGKEDLHSYLNMDDISDADNNMQKEFVKIFK